MFGCYLWLDTERISSFNCDSFVIIINVIAAIRFKLSSSFRLTQSIESNPDNELGEYEEKLRKAVHHRIVIVGYVMSSGMSRTRPKSYK